MPVSPPGSTITFSGAGSATLYLGAIKFSLETQPFDRFEFSNQRLRQAPNSDGSQPQFITLAFGKTAQLFSSCGTTDARPLVPDDANIDNIKRRWDLRRYTIQSLETPLNDALALNTLAQAHTILLERFQAHIAKAQMDLSYSALVAMQSETFSYLTSTGLTMSGMSLGAYGSTSQTNCLIRSYSNEVTYECPTNSSGTASQILCDFSITIDQFVSNKPLSATTWS